MDDRIDWADVAAVGVVAGVRWGNDEHPVSELLQVFEREDDDLDCDLYNVRYALREAFEAGRREGEVVGESRDVEKDAMREMIASLQEENRALRRELAARRAVDGWLAGSSLRRIAVIMPERVLIALADGWTAATGIDYPALAAALGLEVEDE